MMTIGFPQWWKAAGFLCKQGSTALNTDILGGKRYRALWWLRFRPTWRRLLGSSEARQFVACGVTCHLVNMISLALLCFWCLSDAELPSDLGMVRCSRSFRSLSRCLSLQKSWGNPVLYLLCFSSSRRTCGLISLLALISACLGDRMM